MTPLCYLNPLILVSTGKANLSLSNFPDADVQELHPFYVKKESAHDEESSVQQTEPEQG